MKYELIWNYSDVEPGNSPPDPDEFDVHFEFMLRFPHIPPGDGHAVHFCFNVLSPSAVEREDISTPMRGHMGRESFSYAEITETVGRSVADAFSRYDHERALEVLNELLLPRPGGGPREAESGRGSLSGDVEMAKGCTGRNRWGAGLSSLTKGQEQA